MQSGFGRVPHQASHPIEVTLSSSIIMFLRSIDKPSTYTLLWPKDGAHKIQCIGEMENRFFLNGGYGALHPSGNEHHMVLRRGGMTMIECRGRHGSEKSDHVKRHIFHSKKKTVLHFTNIPPIEHKSNVSFPP